MIGFSTLGSLWISMGRSALVRSLERKRQTHEMEGSQRDAGFCNDMRAFAIFLEDLGVA